MLDEDEIVKALSLEEQALDEFKRRRTSNSHQQPVSTRNYEGTKQIYDAARQIKTTSSLCKPAEDLISFNSVVEPSLSAGSTSAAVAMPHQQQQQQPEDPYDRKKQEILQISTIQSQAQQQQHYNLQMMPYVQQPRPSLTPESLNSLYSMNRYSHNHYAAVAPSMYGNYPAIGFSHFIQSSPYNPYQQQNCYQTSNNSQVYWSSVASTSSSAASASSQLPHIVKNGSALPTQLNPPPTPQPVLEQPKPSSSQIYPSLSQTSSSSSSSAVRIGNNTSSALRKDSSNNKVSSDNLIDFDVDDSRDASNILQTFDPLASNRNSTEEAEKTFYTDQDPFDYIYSGGTQCSDPVYDAVVRSEYSFTSSKPQTPHEFEYEKNEKPPPLPPRNDASRNDDKYSSGMVQSFKKKLYENVTHKKKFNRDMIAFYTMVKELRAQYSYDDLDTNVGHIIAAELDNGYTNVSSIKLLVYPSKECFKGTKLPDSHSQENYIKLDGYGSPIVFTCDINSNVLHVIMHVLVELESDINGSTEDFALKTIGSQEWLCSESALGRLEYIQNNIKLEKDILLGLLPKQERFTRILARTHQDDVRDAEIRMENILPKDSYSAISYDTLMILLETLELEIDKLESASILHPSGVVQAVKAICAHLGLIDTVELSNAVKSLEDACNSRPGNQSAFVTKPTIKIESEKGNYAKVTLRQRTTVEDVSFQCGLIRDAVLHILEMYSSAFNVNFSVNGPKWNSAPICITNINQSVMLNVVALHRPPSNWKHDEYMLGAQIYHGTRFLGEPLITHCSNSLQGLYPRLTFDSWLSFEDVPVCALPREARLIFVLYGCTKEPVEGASNDSQANTSGHQENRMTKIELGWTAIQFFDFERKMIQGTYFLSLWPPSSDKYYCPAPPEGTHPLVDSCPVLSIEIPVYCGKLAFPEPISGVPEPEKLDFECLDGNTREELLDTIDESVTFSKLDRREVLWEKRHYLHEFPKALPKILNAAHSWDYACHADLHALLKSWSPLKPLEAIELLLPRFPDLAVREQATKWISRFSNDDLVDYLPQLLQALKHDIYEASPLSCLLLGRAMESPRVAHYLYWLLIQNLPGDMPQNSLDVSRMYEDEYLLLQARFHRRNQLMLRALLAICGENLSSRFLAQNLMCKALDDVAKSVKLAKDNTRLSILRLNIENVHQILTENPTSLPLSPGLEVRGVQASTCMYFNSNTLPLKVNFYGPDNLVIPAIYKLGDDLQQDMLTLQIVRIIDKMWLKEGLNLKIVSYACIPTGAKKGVIEMITNAETLRKIQVECGLTGSFKDKPIAEWLAKQNPNQLEYQRSVENFTLSCAGYSIITYILGICDRHNDNIMLKTSGHLFHIDFGKFLGDAQMFGNFKRDRTPFVLTSDMAFVINCGDKPSSKFQNFVDICCKAFNIVRKNGDLLLHIFALMASSGIPGVTSDAVNYVRNALMPGASNAEASANFAKMIHVSLKSWFTQFNFFLHNIAQMRFGNEPQGCELLSFIPKAYTVEQDGEIIDISVHGYQKRYDLEKYYTYILKVYRRSQPDPVFLFRTYKEFCEFYQKLCLQFPIKRFHSPQTGMSVGRSNIKTVADKRLPEVRKFIESLLNASEILNSDLVITFFHPLLRDQQEANIHALKVRETAPESESNICGEIKFSIHYHRGALIVMIHHARSLPMTTKGIEPNTYVKTYLIPDKSKITKRKTKIIKKSCFPSFMETLEYRMPLQIIRLKTLQVTVWGNDPLQENEFLGGVQIPLNSLDLKEEIIGWHRLNFLPRSN